MKATNKWSDLDLQSAQKGIAVAIVNDKDEILVMDHVKTGKWLVPTGGVEDGDSLLKTVFKEMFEELNIKVTSVTFIGDETNKYVRNESDVYVTVSHYVVNNYKGRIVNNEPHKHRSLRWLSKKDFDVENRMESRNFGDITRYIFNNFMTEFK